MNRASLAVALGVAASAIAAGPAAAANLSMGTDNVLQYVDGANQDNHVTVTNGQPGGLLVQDTTALNATPSCTPTPSFSLSATCAPTNGLPLQRYMFFLNAGNDYLDLRQATLAGDRGVLNGGPGADSVFAGAGDDTINVGGDAVSDAYGCGGGFDVVSADLVDHHALADLAFVTIGGRAAAISACEVVNAAPAGEQPTVGLPRALRARHGVVRVRIACPAAHDGGGCAGTLRLDRVVAGGTERTVKLGTAAFKIARGHGKAVRIGTGHGTGRVQATATEHDAQGRPKTTTRQLILR
jgi:hypothetical protein